MSAIILLFPRVGVPLPAEDRLKTGSDPDPVSGRPPELTRQWTEQHLPLIDAAMDLLQADDGEFARRCRTIAEAEGPSVLDQLAAQLDKLGTHVGDVVSALAMTAMRIRTTMATGGAGA